MVFLPISYINVRHIICQMLTYSIKKKKKCGKHLQNINIVYMEFALKIV